MNSPALQWHQPLPLFSKFNVDAIESQLDRLLEENRRTLAMLR